MILNYTLTARLSADAAWSILATGVLGLSLDTSGKLGVELDVLVIMFDKDEFELFFNLAVTIQMTINSNIIFFLITGYKLITCI